MATKFDPKIPFNDLPLLPPAEDIETKAVLKKCIEATRQLEGLRQAAKRIPNQDVLINSIPLREAKDSSAIENIVTTNDKLFRFASANDEHADPSTREILRYRTALRNGFDNLKIRPLTVQTALTLCRTIKGYDLDVRAVPGTTLRNHATDEVIYTPPEGAAVINEKLRNWEQYLHEDNGIDPIIRMAIGHYQFEAIHPFPDGNGRTGRALNILYLIDQKRLDLPILYLSQYINANRDSYYRLLTGVTTNGDWEPWILFMLEAVQFTARWTTEKIEAVKALMEETVRHVKLRQPRIYSRELVELLFTQPYCRTGDVVASGIASRNIAAKYLKELAAADVLLQRKDGREVLYINVRFLDLLKSNEHGFQPFPAA
ncbi:Fic family protein [Hyphomicrobium sp. 99]|uniref:Fic family protein n=1 Tax=Hyphomicrobium sp. 99 TaxID=1163419 RepID=UPI0009E54A65|nr:Fic family protein [Hyphomicrobium sp. 99]